MACFTPLLNRGPASAKFHSSRSPFEVSLNPVAGSRRKALWINKQRSKFNFVESTAGATQMPKKLTNRQRRFALAYASDPQHNGTKAALAAGCPKTSAHVMASRWLKNTDVQNHVEQFLGRVAQKYELSAEKVIQELCKLAFANMADYVEINREGVAFLSLSEITRDQAAAIHEVTLENCARGDTKNANARTTLRLRLADKVRSLELLGKFLQLFGKDSVSASAPVRVIVVDSPRPYRPPVPAFER